MVICTGRGRFNNEPPSRACDFSAIYYTDVRVVSADLRDGNADEIQNFTRFSVSFLIVANLDSLSLFQIYIVFCKK